MVLARFSWFYLVLDGFISFEVVLGRLSLFLTLVIIVRRSYYRGWLLHLSDISISDTRPQIWNPRPRILISGRGFESGFED